MRQTLLTSLMLLGSEGFAWPLSAVVQYPCSVTRLRLRKPSPAPSHRAVRAREGAMESQLRCRQCWQVQKERWVLVNGDWLWSFLAEVLKVQDCQSLCEWCRQALLDR